MNVIAIDSGGTKIVGSVVDHEGNILAQKRHENTGQSGDFFVDTYRRIIGEYKEAFDAKAAAIGCNGRIDIKNGIVLDCAKKYPNWINRPIKAELEAQFGLPVHVDNDCRMGIEGEIWLGAAKGYRSVVGLMIGTGIGGGVAFDGDFVYGACYGAGEIGHTILHPGGRLCNCGQRGCAEMYVSGTALWKGYNMLSGKESMTSGYEFFQAHEKGDGIAKEVLDEFVSDLAYMLVTCCNLLNPDVLLLGGGLTDTKEHWREALERSFEQKASKFNAQTPIAYAKMGNKAALLGAAKMALSAYGTAPDRQGAG